MKWLYFCFHLTCSNDSQVGIVGDSLRWYAIHSNFLNTQSVFTILMFAVETWDWQTHSSLYGFWGRNSVPSLKEALHDMGLHIPHWLFWDRIWDYYLRSPPQGPVKYVVKPFPDCQVLPRTHWLMTSAFFSPHHLQFCKGLHFCKWMGLFMATTSHVGQLSSVSMGTRK